MTKWLEYGRKVYNPDFNYGEFAKIIAVLGVEGEDYISPFYEIGKFVNAER